MIGYTKTTCATINDDADTDNTGDFDEKEVKKRGTLDPFVVRQLEEQLVVVVKC